MFVGVSPPGGLLLIAEPSEMAWSPPQHHSGAVQLLCGGAIDLYPGICDHRSQRAGKLQHRV